MGGLFSPARVYMYTVLIISSAILPPSAGCEVLYCPAGVNNKLPSGVNDRRRKKDVKVSFAYKFAFLDPKLMVLPKGFGECSIGLTAGKGIDGAGDADLRIEGDDPKDERLLCEIAGGFIGSAREVGVPGMEGAGDAGANDVPSEAACVRSP